jgi:hypothetical protein
MQTTQLNIEHADYSVIPHAKSQYYYSRFWGPPNLLFFGYGSIFLHEMGGACSTYGRKKRCIHDFGGET